MSCYKLVAALVLLSTISTAAPAEDIAVGTKVFWKDGAKAKVGAKEVSAQIIPWPATVKEVLGDYLLLGPAWVHKSDVRTTDEAIKYYTDEIEKEPSVERYRRRGDIWQTKDKYDNAIDDYTKALQIDPKDKYSYNNRGNSRFANKNYALAIQDYTEALEIDPKYILSLFGRANALAEVKDYDAAMQDFAEILRLNPNVGNVYLHRGVALTKKGDYAAALKDFNQLKQRAPRSPDGYNTVAWLLATCPVASFRNGKSAVEHATRACELSGWKEAGYLDTLAAAYAEAGDFKKAEETSNKAIELGATDAEKADFGTRLALYQAGKPFRDEPKK